MNDWNRFFASMLFLGCLLIIPLTAHAESELNDHALIAALQQGGYNLYFRHEATDWSQQDAVFKRDDWLSCDGSLVRQLSAEGRQRAKRTGQAMRSLRIPVGEVVASPYCRTMETARQLGLGDVKASNEVINMLVANYFGGREALVKTAQGLLASRPKAGSNRVIVAHGNVAQAATPVYPGEGEMVAFKPDGQGQFTFVGRIKPERWVEISQGY